MKYLLIMEYDGSEFYGYQKQKGLRTIEGQLELALEKLTKKKIMTYGAGRTDKGVHAMGQVVHFTAEIQITPYRLIAGLNHFLPDDIQIIHCEEASAFFHARFHAKEKSYKYFLYNDYFMPPTLRKYRGHRNYPLDMEAMERASRYLMGDHDFRAFTQDLPPDENTHRILNDIKIQKIDHDIVFTFRGRSFLKNMIRIIVGSLIDVGRGKHPPEWILEVLESKDREKAGMTVEPGGLYLWDIRY
ncbi:MAG: tRNA pseudouridine(38-40) synthase TruA [Tissierellia bacterium]|nr:tRNA pseudouridine(38-40) synthase TruA [Tissierellia bacterium]